MENMLDRCQEAGMTLASYKVQVGKKVSLAGQIFNGSTHYADPNNVETVTKFPRPKCLKKLTGWMGTCNQLSHCVPWLAGEQPQFRQEHPPGDLMR